MKWVFGVLAAIVLLAVAAGLALPFLVDTPRVQALIAGNAAQALGRPVKFASASVALLPLPAVELRRLEVAEDPAFGRTPFLTLERGRLRLRLRPLLAGRVEFGDLVLEGPVITLVQGADGRFNVASLGGGSAEARGPARPGRGAGGPGGPAGAGAPALASRVRIERGVVTYASRAGQGPAVRWRLEDVDVTLANGGPALAFEGEARLAPGDVVAKVREGRLALDGRGLLEAPLAARVTLDGKDVSALVAAVAGPATGVAGPVRATLAVTGTLGAPRAAGDLELASARVTRVQPACPEPTRRTLALDSLRVAAAWQDARFTGRPVTTRLGGGTLTANVTASLERGVRIQVTDLAIKALPLERVLVDFLCQGYAVAAPLELTGALAFSGADPLGTLSGPGRLRIGPGRVVGAQALRLMDGVVRLGGAVSALLAADVPAALFGSPLEFDSITGTYRIADGVATTRDLLYTSRAMKVAVAGDYALGTGRMNLTLRINHGRGEVKALVAGTAAAPSIRVVPSTILRDVRPREIESGLQDLLRRFRR
ncbi:MAG TPA: hypothetical protein DDZ42_21345 [Candidatus Rokubacteria bacterium]|nr:MAG: hypothetical protein A2050_06830 [Candidatus Rokubacteria bacterium GWA2_73_35]HBH04423.1 hypothetical protein [Candidatus Rokubacteria bacterium]